MLLWGLFGITVAAGVMYAVALMLLRVSTAGVDQHGKPLAGQIPSLAKPVRSHFRTHAGTEQDLRPDGLRRRLLRDAAELRRNGPRRHLGRPILGPVLGLGPEGKRGRPHRAVELADPARPLGRVGEGSRCRSAGDLRERDDRVELVRDEPTEHRIARLRLRFAPGRRMRELLGQPTLHTDMGSDPEALLGQRHEACHDTHGSGVNTPWSRAPAPLPTHAKAPPSTNGSANGHTNGHVNGTPNGNPKRDKKKHKRR